MQFKVRRLVVSLALFVLIVLFGLVGNTWAGSPVLDIGIVLNKPSIGVTCSSGLLVRSKKNGPLLIRMSKDRKLLFNSVGKNIQTLGNRKGKQFFIEPAGRGFLSVHGKEYRGDFIVKLSVKTSGLNLVNQINIEEYLKGVLKAEMLASFKAEALKAQAVLSRTFALKHKDQFRSRGYGLKASEQSQMYKGVAGEDTRTDAAVKSTKGVVLEFNNELIEASYHSCCGGRTENNEAVWKGTPKPYTRSVRCQWCSEAPHYEWKTELAYSDIEFALSRHGWKLGSISKIDLDYSESGRVRYVIVTTEAGREVYIPGNKFRIIVDRRKLKSLKFIFKDDPVGDLLAMNPELNNPKEDSIISSQQDKAIQSIISGYLDNYAVSKKILRVTGRGFGHGVGFCQWGAQGLAKKRLTFSKILAYYYKGTEISKIY